MGAKQSTFDLLNDKEVEDQIKEPHRKHIHTFNSEEFYTLQQYTINGDILLNSFLRGTDTLQMYQDIFINYPDSVIQQLKEWEEYKNTSIRFAIGIPRFYFIPLFLLGYTEEPKQIKNTAEEVIRIRQRINYYKTIKSIIEIKKDNLDFYRNIMFRFFQQFIKIAETFPLSQVTKPFIVFRGVKKMFYSLDKTKVNILPAFESTTLNTHVAVKFAGNYGTKLMYIVSPECQYIYLQPVSYVTPPEEEILLLPGHRYCYIYTNKMDTHIFAILPPTDESLDLVMNSTSKGIPKINKNIKNTNSKNKTPKSRTNFPPLPPNTNENENNTNTIFNNNKYIENVTKWIGNQEGKGRRTRRRSRQRQRGGAKGDIYANRWNIGHENVIVRNKTKEENEYLQYLKSIYLS
jgi:hypothetical protein